MVPKAHYGRATGMMSLIETGPGVLGHLAPAVRLAETLLPDHDAGPA